MTQYCMSEAKTKLWKSDTCNIRLATILNLLVAGICVD